MAKMMVRGGVEEEGGDLVSLRWNVLLVLSSTLDWRLHFLCILMHLVRKFPYIMSKHFDIFFQNILVYIDILFHYARMSY